MFALTDLLVAQERYDEAALVWRQATAPEAVALPAEVHGSLIYDGGFEKDVSGGGFGWQQTDVPGADFDYDTEVKHSGLRSARIIFDGTQNLNYEQLFQYVIVSPERITGFTGICTPIKS